MYKLDLEKAEEKEIKLPTLIGLQGKKEREREFQSGRWKSWLKTQHSKDKDDIWSHHFMTDRWAKVETMTDFLFQGSKITTDGECHHGIKNTCSLEEKLCQTQIVH